MIGRLFRVILLLAVAAIGLSAYWLYGGTEEFRTEGRTRQLSQVWADFPFESHYVNVLGSDLHYIDEGDADGQVFLFLHGNPTSSYLWRNIVPIVAAEGRAIAVDNVGFGGSDRPDIGYTFIEHAEYLDAFIEELDLQNIILVIHDWGSAMGFDYAFRNPDRVRGIVFMEAIMGIPSIADLPDQMRTAFTGMRTPVIGEFTVQMQNMFIEVGMPGGVVRQLSEFEHNAYREPFPTWASRKAVLVWPREIPFDGSPENTAARVRAFSDWLPTSPHPKLHLYVTGGALTAPGAAEAMQESWTNITSEMLGEGRHYVQEDHPDAIGKAIVDWHQSTFAAQDAPDNSETEETNGE
jgi:haloalkane dehalogenase